ncbi:hypothetical protein TNCV_3478051 [Trichonephila clavipes]|nr:hypothetical protein TNCV_3478051 [Trichonephila clavipes]
MSDDRQATSSSWALFWVEAYWGAQPKTHMELSRKSPSLRRRSECDTIMASFISWNCRGMRTRLDDLKSIIST